MSPLMIQRRWRPSSIAISAATIATCAAVVAQSIAAASSTTRLCGPMGMPFVRLMT
jgi:hypothetical protein